MLRGPRVSTVILPPGMTAATAPAQSPRPPVSPSAGGPVRQGGQQPFAVRPGQLTPAALNAAPPGVASVVPAPTSGQASPPHQRRAVRARAAPEREQPALRTARLALRRPLLADLDEYALLMADPDVVSRTLDADGQPMRAFTREESFVYAAHGFARVLAQWESAGFGPFAVCMQRRNGSCGGLVGIAGLRARAEEVAPPEPLPGVGVAAGVPAENRTETELIYTLGRPFWGHGLGREVVTATVADGFGRIGLSQIVAFTVPPQIAVTPDAALASARILIGLGFVEGPLRAGYGVYLRSFSLAKPLSPAWTSPPTLG